MKQPLVGNFVIQVRENGVIVTFEPTESYYYYYWFLAEGMILRAKVETMAFRLASEAVRSTDVESLRIPGPAASQLFSPLRHKACSRRDGFSRHAKLHSPVPSGRFNLRNLEAPVVDPRPQS
jgi:hypothetical protein